MKPFIIFWKFYLESCIVIEENISFLECENFPAVKVPWKEGNTMYCYGVDNIVYQLY